MNISSKMLVIGLDGITMEQPWKGALAFMPFLSNLITETPAQSFETIIPNNSVCCWQTFFTGVDPSYHSMPDFFTFDWKKGKISLITSASRTAPTLWEIASQQGLYSIVFNVPGTFPATPVKGILVAGSPIISRYNLTYPQSLPTHLKRVFAYYRHDLDFDTSTSREPNISNIKVAKDIKNILKSHILLMHTLLREKWDVFVGILTMTDRLLHFFYNVVKNQESAEPQLLDIVRSCFELVDDSIKHIVTKFKDSTEIIIVSDHGFQAKKYQFSLASWLEMNGFTTWSSFPNSVDSKKPDTIRVSIEKSILIPTPASGGGIWINSRLLQSSKKRKEIIEQLKAKLLLICDPEGEPLIEAVVPREKLYHGPDLNSLPDIFLLTTEGKNSLTSRIDERLFLKPVRQGIHSRCSYCLCIGKKLCSHQPTDYRFIYQSFREIFGIKSFESYYRYS